MKPEELVERGFRVFPLYGVEIEEESRSGWCQCSDGVHCAAPGKHPRIRNWRQEATTDLAKVKRWETAYPGTNWAIATDGLVVMDVDPRNGGAESYYWLETKDVTPWPATLTVRTGGGGTHEVYRAPASEDVGSGTLLEGIDIKADGGYIVAPGSRHVTGRTYEVARDLPLAPAPGWLRPARKTSSESGLLTIEQGQRHTAFLQRAGYLRNAGLEAPEILAALEALNQRLDDPLPDDEVRAIAEGYGQYESRWDQVKDKYGPRELIEEHDGPLITTAAERRDRPEPRWRVKGLMPETGVGQIYGPTYSGKTFLALDLALTISTGLPRWQDRFEVQQHGPVVYILMEGAFGFTQRIKAWVSSTGLEDDQLYTVEEKPIDLMNPDILGQLSTAMKGTLPEAPALVVVDTQSLATPGLEENSNTDMTRLYLGLKQWSRTLGCPVLVVHHTGHERGRARGASAQKAALDFEIEVEPRDDTDRKDVRVTKVKEAEPHEPWQIELERHGGSVVAVPAGSAKAGPEPRVPEVDEVIELLRDVLADGQWHHTDELRGSWEVRFGQTWAEGKSVRRAARVAAGVEVQDAPREGGHPRHWYWLPR